MRLDFTLLMACSFLLATSAQGGQFMVVPGQVNDFEDGTTQEWAVGVGSGTNDDCMPPSPVNVVSTQLDGNALEIISTGDPAGAPMQLCGRLTALNFGAGWNGDYLALGIDSVEMDLFNTGNEPLSVRILVASFNFVTAQFRGAFYSTVPVPIAPGEVILGERFSLLEGDVTVAFPGSDTYLDTLSRVTMLRIFHNPDGGTRVNGLGDQAPFVTASLEVDNITAVPEASAAVASVCLLVLSLVARRRVGSER
jgi:hypothetical protein